MKASIALLGVLTALKDDFVLVELTLFDGNVNLDDILPDDATGTDVEVTGGPINLRNESPLMTTRTRLQNCP